MALATWDPGGTVGDMFRTVARFLPPPPPGSRSPLLWGDPEHVRSVFGDRLRLEFAPAVITLAGDGEPEERAEQFMAVFPSLVMARSLLESEGRWEEAEPQIRRAVEAMYRTPPTYLLITGTKPL